jgi:predicted AAA+ superfamily ATPase
VNKFELSNTLDLDSRKLSYFLDILSGTYVINLISPYFTNTRKEISKMNKVYFNNLSVINYYTGNYFDNLDTIDGSFIENFVLNSLKEKVTNKLKYYRTISKSEIDFIIDN